MKIPINGIYKAPFEDDRSRPTGIVIIIDGKIYSVEISKMGDDLVIVQEPISDNLLLGLEDLRIDDKVKTSK